MTVAYGMACLTGARLRLTGMPKAYAQDCTRDGSLKSCDDGRTRHFTGDAILWADGTPWSASPRPSVIIGNKPSARVGPGVFVGNLHGKGSVPLDDPNARNKRQCAILDGVAYCH